jgi:hypothetical protein
MCIYIVYVYIYIVYIYSVCVYIYIVYVYIYIVYYVNCTYTVYNVYIHIVDRYVFFSYVNSLCVYNCVCIYILIEGCFNGTQSGKLVHRHVSFPEDIIATGVAYLLANLLVLEEWNGQRQRVFF